ncbi:hypothetical protein BpHYR1_029791 [Brachionus plicatilis]|uniref:Uncharacterized protein n=1 Tax=Brachionus plicatilis TaxID=10195 RepID=A0A3M7RAQ1_BRAPC|nr:hypothetical protein BpHYR1_029791 [Brachionus plicatilis]
MQKNLNGAKKNIFDDNCLDNITNLFSDNFKYFSEYILSFFDKEAKLERVSMRARLKYPVVGHSEEQLLSYSSYRLS